MENRDFGNPSGISLVDIHKKMFSQLQDYVELLYWNKIQYVEFEFTLEKVVIVISLSASGNFVNVRIKAGNTIMPDAVYEQFMRLEPGIKPTRRNVWDYVYESQQLFNFLILNPITAIRLKPSEESNANI